MYFKNVLALNCVCWFLVEVGKPRNLEKSHWNNDSNSTRRMFWESKPQSRTKMLEHQASSPLPALTKSKIGHFSLFVVKNATFSNID